MNYIAFQMKYYMEEGKKHLTQVTFIIFKIEI